MNNNLHTKFEIPDSRFFSSRSARKAFTLLETLIVIGITGILAGVGVSSYINQQKAKLLDSTAQEIVGYLRYAQQKSMAQEEGKQWGVHFENSASGNDFYALYSGASYTSPAETRYLPKELEFQLPSSGNSVNMSFEKLTGFLSGASYEQIILQDFSGNAENVLVCRQGIVASNRDISVCGEIDITAPIVSSVTASNVSYGSYVDSPFDLSANINEEQGGLLSCEYTINGGSNWYTATRSGTGPSYTCTKTGISAANGANLTLNMRATSQGGTGTGTSISRTIDTVAPTCSDNWTDNWTTTTPVNITIASNDTASGVGSTKYCIDTTNTCTPTTVGTSVSVICASGSACTQYIRYAAWDNVNNTSSVYSKRVRQDKQNPTASDNWTDNWTTTTPVNITITPSDGSGSGISTTKYCVDTANTCTPTTVGTSASVSCASGSACTQYVRYQTWDIVNNASSIYSKRVRQDKQAPTDGTLTAEASGLQVSLSWTAASDGSGSGLASSNTYKLVFLTTGYPAANCTTGTQIYLGSGTSYTHTGLTSGQTYYYRVCAYDAVSNISTGATASATPVLKANGETCTSGTECLSGYCYVDNDGDRYAPASGTKKCQLNSQLSGTDCCDSDSRAYPGESTYYSSTNNCGSWDYNCSGSIEKSDCTGGCTIDLTNKKTGYNNRTCSPPSGSYAQDCYTTNCSYSCGTTFSYCYCQGFTGSADWADGCSLWNFYRLGQGEDTCVYK